MSRRSAPLIGPDALVGVSIGTGQGSHGRGAVRPRRASGPLGNARMMADPPPLLLGRAAERVAISDTTDSETGRRSARRSASDVRKPCPESTSHGARPARFCDADPAGYEPPRGGQIALAERGHLPLRITAGTRARQRSCAPAIGCQRFRRLNVSDPAIGCHRRSGERSRQSGAASAATRSRQPRVIRSSFYTQPRRLLPEGREPAAKVRESNVRERDRSRAMGRRPRDITRTIRRRTPLRPGPASRPRPRDRPAAGRAAAPPRPRRRCPLAGPDR